MEQPRLESKDSAARTRPHTTTPRVDVIVLTSDTALLAILRAAVGPGQQLFFVESSAAAVDLLIGGHCGIFIIDVALVGNSVAELIESLHIQFPEVVLLATGQRVEQNAVASLVGSGRIYRFLHKPVSPARAELFLRAAAQRYNDLHPHDSRSMQAGGSLPSTRDLKMLGVALAALAAIVATAWMWPSVQLSTHPTEVVASSTVRSTQLDELLSKAEAAYAAGHLVTPSADGALDYYRAALQIDPHNNTAEVAVGRIVSAVATQANDALAARDIQRARGALTTLQRIAPAHPNLAALKAAVAAATRNNAVGQPSGATAPPASTSAQAAVNAPFSATPNVNQARAYLTINQLTEPSDASALGMLRRAREKGENESAVQITATDLGSRLLNNALAAVDVGNADDAKTLHAAAMSLDREFETALPDLELVESRISDLERSTREVRANALLDRAIRLRLSGQLLEPTGDNAFEAFQAAMAEDSTSAEAKLEQQRLAFALLEDTRTALAAGDIDRADILAGRAEEISPGAPQTRTLREQVGAARRQREEATSVVQAASLPRRREIPAVYPRHALLNEIEGWVDLEFTISAKGVPSEITVKGAEPAGIFDTAASQALRQWRFEPIRRDGTARARLRMEFKLKG